MVTPHYFYIVPILLLKKCCIKMELSIYNESVFKKYHSKAQIARVLTESWFENEMYCPNCLHTEFNKNPNNTQVSDFLCSYCKNEYQLKAQAKPFYSKIVDGAYRPMMDSLKFGIAPSFSFMSYSSQEWLVQNLFVIPKFFFSESIIEKRNPLSSKARRAGWQGCNILLSRLPQMGKIKVIENGSEIPRKNVQASWKKLLFMNKEDYKGKAWTSDVLCCVQKLNKKEFNLNEVYSYEDYLAKLHPNNYNIKPKIRQQLQILRDKGILKFEGNGKYVVKI